MLYADFNVFNELQVNGRDLGDPNDNNTANTDYTADDDNGGNDGDNTPDNPADAPDDYTVPDQGEDQTPAEADNNPPDQGTEADPNAGDEGGNTDEGGGDATDYTQGGDDTGDAGGGDEGGGDTGGGSDEGGDAGGAEGGDEGGDAGDEGGDDTGDDTGGDDGDNMSDDDIKQLEDDLFSKFNDQQIAIMTKDLKKSYLKMYDVLDTLIERINDTPKEDAYIKIIAFVTDRLADLRDMLDDYMVDTFNTKSFIENQINYKRFCIVLRQINSIVASIYPEFK